MPDDKKPLRPTRPARPAPPVESPPEPVPAAPSLARAAESGDPAVHQVLAELGTARANGDDAAVAALTARLADLGFQ